MKRKKIILKKQKHLQPEHPVNILFCGTGGQGVLKAAEVCGWAAVFDGYHAKKSEVHGMAQRGGSVESHLRFGTRVYSPLIPYGEADFLVVFHKDEGLRLQGFLRKKGIDLTGYLQQSRESVADPRFLNTFLLGILSRYLPLSEESWLQALDNVFAGKFQRENADVFLKARRSR